MKRIRWDPRDRVKEQDLGGVAPRGRARVSEGRVRHRQPQADPGAGAWPSPGDGVIFGEIRPVAATAKRVSGEESFESWLR